MDDKSSCSVTCFLIYKIKLTAIDASRRRRMVVRTTAACHLSCGTHNKNSFPFVDRNFIPTMTEKRTSQYGMVVTLLLMNAMEGCTKHEEK